MLIKLYSITKTQSPGEKRTAFSNELSTDGIDKVTTVNNYKWNWKTQTWNGEKRSIKNVQFTRSPMTTNTNTFKNGYTSVSLSFYHRHVSITNFMLRKSSKHNFT